MALPTSGLTVYHNPQCTKSRKSTACLEENQEQGNYQVEVVKYKATPPSRERLQVLVEYLGMRSDSPTIERPWKEDRPWDYLLRPEAQGKATSYDEAFDIIENDPAMLERPFVIDWDRKIAVLGRPDISRVEKLVEDRKAGKL
ncbi:hypothetical protein BDB00DRAFT_866657 [Zychaea mexicana]|uniref:uncharacterized protein n=1 Tax=Zychaea mexicana TaxID=64656 RepID=UPI0022FF007A|nr:uncharacterized protein BDB00DRAFT_866657 [Zychaea mexicana]KAI9499170.1 hypothetical protein BDB00DRAFT_866657 [Zychaea mexicana]